MDGIDSRGQVVVIGSTNRIDSIDPALRRPGRFDREFLFPLPNREARRTILKIHTEKWEPKPDEELVDNIADNCVGYCGADLKSLCTETALIALRRRYPQIYKSSDKLLINPQSIVITPEDFAVAMKQLTPASERSVVGHAKALAKILSPLVSPALNYLKECVRKAFPSAEFVSDKEKSLEDSGCGTATISPGGSSVPKGGSGVVPVSRGSVEASFSRPYFLVCGNELWGKSLFVHLGPALLYEMERYPCYTIDVPSLFGSSEAKTPEELCVCIVREARRHAPCILYLPRIHTTWSMASPTVKSTLKMLIEDIPLDLMVMVVATCTTGEEVYCDADGPRFLEDFRCLFSLGSEYHVPFPSKDLRMDFFSQLEKLIRKEPTVEKPENMVFEELPKVEMSSQIHLSKYEVNELEEKEENALRELRIYLRSVTENLFTERKLSCFFKPVNPEEVS